jgi:hypothetical protein
MIARVAHPSWQLANRFSKHPVFSYNLAFLTLDLDPAGDTCRGPELGPSKMIPVDLKLAFSRIAQLEAQRSHVRLVILEQSRLHLDSLVSVSQKALRYSDVPSRQQ